MPGLIIIPAYNEEGSLEAVLEKLESELSPRADILIVNDGSSDGTDLILKKSGLKHCTLPCNLGYALALKTGLRYGLTQDYSWFSFMDADGQHRYEDMIKLIDSFEVGEHDLMVGSRWLNKKDEDSQELSARRAGMLFFCWLTAKMTGQKLTDTTSGMKIMNREVARELLENNFGDLHSEMLIYLHDRGYKIGEVPIVVDERVSGSSMYSFQDAILYPWRNLILIFIFKMNSWTLKKIKNKSLKG